MDQVKTKKLTLSTKGASNGKTKCKECKGKVSVIVKDGHDYKMLQTVMM